MQPALSGCLQCQRPAFPCEQLLPNHLLLLSQQCEEIPGWCWLSSSSVDDFSWLHSLPFQVSVQSSPCSNPNPGENTPFHSLESNAAPCLLVMSTGRSSKTSFNSSTLAPAEVLACGVINSSACLPFDTSWLPRGTHPYILFSLRGSLPPPCHSVPCCRCHTRQVRDLSPYPTVKLSCSPYTKSNSYSWHDRFVEQALS